MPNCRCSPRQTRKFLTISELNELIKGTLESRLDALWVQGEISNFRMPAVGPFLFHPQRRQEPNQRRSCFAARASLLRFTPENGMAVLCFGRVSLYTVRGDLQLYVEDMEPQGQGALSLAFEQLKKKLAAEGLFAPRAQARACRFCRETIGIVTSDKGAALHDMLRIIGDRYPERRVVIRPVKVQGDGAAREIAERHRRFESSRYYRCHDRRTRRRIVGRLWAFNEEVVARAIYRVAGPGGFGGGT